MSTFFDEKAAEEYRKMEAMPTEVSAESLKRWEDYKFLIGLDEPLKGFVALGYEQAAWLLVHEDWHKHDWRMLKQVNNSISTIIFAIIRRIVITVNEPIDIIDLWESMLSFCKVFDDTTVDVIRLKSDAVNDIDVEASLTLMFCSAWILKHDYYKVVRIKEETV